MRVEMKAIDTKRPRKLDLNAPLLSTRRSNLTACSNSIELSRSSSIGCSCERVPFLWEQSPGKPKDTIGRGNAEDFKALPLPKPPPIRWQEEPTLTLNEGRLFDGVVDANGDYYKDEYDNVVNANDEGKRDNDNDNDGCSDAIDLLSLADSLYTSSERLECVVCEGEDCESDFGDSNGSLSPNFMIKRFLPAATALAASSLSALAVDKEVSSAPVLSSEKHLMRVYPSSNMNVKEGSCVPRPRVAGEAYNSSKACGLEILFQWRVKHRLCGVKSPVRSIRPSLKPQLSPRNKLAIVSPKD